jgi:hypothetical protein
MTCLPALGTTKFLPSPPVLKVRTPDHPPETRYMSVRWSIATVATAILGVACALVDGRAGETPDVAGFRKDVAPLLSRYCASCHGGSKPKGDLALDRLQSPEQSLKARSIWERVATRVRAREMPPSKKPQPTAGEAQKLLGWLDRELARTQPRSAGRVTLHRLNRVEYNNTIRDLVGVHFTPADDFPADDVGYGFDNIGDVLSLPPLLLEKYLAATERIVVGALRDPKLRDRILIRQPTDKDHEACARFILESFARRAYRRPVAQAELDRLVKLVRQAEQQGDSFEQAVQMALEALLVSPHFLFRVELDPGPVAAGSAHPISDFELASRLSYFLWSTMPDAELFELAGRGVLHEKSRLEEQARRLLHDPKSLALGENFAGQWLQLRGLSGAAPDPGRFPTFDDALRAAMRQETELFFEAIVREDRPVTDFLDARFTFVNERLAKHYGITGVHGEAMRRIELTGEQRGGLVTQASILTVTSNPTRTSPVKRGKWILDNLLAAPPPPPPPGVEPLGESKEVVLSGSLRQRMERHRTDANCAVCHQRMDPLGFGLENFDAVGAWRDRDGSFPVDSSGTLPDGRSFQGPTGLRAVLRARADDFRHCLTEKLLTYALGRGLESYDRPAVDQVVAALKRGQDRFSSLVLAVVASDPFLMRQGKGVNR